MKKRRFLIPTCVVGGLAVLCLGVFGLMQYFGSPLIPGSLERRYTREVSSHREELTAFANACLDSGQVPSDLPLPGLVKRADLWKNTGGDLCGVFLRWLGTGTLLQLLRVLLLTPGSTGFPGGGGKADPTGRWLCLAGRGGQPWLYQGDRRRFLLL